MKIVNIFLASSIKEFEKERILIGDYVRRINEISSAKGYLIRLFLCEDEYNNSQSVYDRQIQKSDIFFAIIGEHLGEFTRHEIFDVADCCDSIKERILVFTTDIENHTITAGLRNRYQLLKPQNNLLECLKGAINDAITNVLDSIEQISTVPIVPNSFFLDIPDWDTLECAVIGNIIRRLKDQGNEIVISHDNKESMNAFVALLDNDFGQEINRIVQALKDGVPSDLFWVFANKSILDNTDLSIKEQVNNISNCLGDKYFDSYQTYQVLSIVFYNRLLAALMQHNLLDGSGFVYTVCDHWLVRKGSTFGHNFINLLNTKLDPDSEEQARKERVIVNLLNYYWLNGKLEKHIKAIDAIQRAQYDYFVYTEEDLNELTLKRSEYKQAVADYVYDNLELLQLNIVDYSGQDTLLLIKNILNIANDEGNFPSEDVFKIYFFAANALSFYNSQLVHTYELYAEALDGYCKIEQPSLKIIESAKLCCLQLCQISSELSLDKDTIKWIEYAERFFYDGDLLFKSIILMQKKTAYRNRDNNIEVECNKELVNIFQNSFVEQDNVHLNLYLEYRYWCIWNDFPNIPKYKDEVNTLIDNYYVPYLASDYNYFHTGIKLFSLYVLREEDDELDDDNSSFCNDVIQQYIDCRNFDDRSIDYYNLLFVKATILKKTGKTSDAIDLFVKLSEMYRGKRDRACCFQSVALCYMDDYCSSDALKSAENYYRLAMSLFDELNDRHRIGNIFDGLSYCYLLQKNYSEALTYAKKSISIQEYDCPNKYSNYISSLLCQDMYDNASDYYHKTERKEDVLLQLQKDYNSEITKLNICVDVFKRFISEHNSI